MLYGRDREMHAVAGLLADARAGRSGVLAIVGEPGIGKSALLTYAQEQSDGMNVLRARGVQSEANIPFAGLLELLRPALAQLAAIPSPQAEALQSALALRPARAQDRFAIGAATLSLIAAYAETRPVAVLIDDGQWLDGSSGDALLFAIRRFVADPVAVVITVREGESSLLDGSDLATMHLAGLDLAATEQLLADQLGAASRKAAADHLHRETGGNPLALLELAAHPELLDESLTGIPVPVGTSVANAYLLRLGALPRETREVLVLAAAVDHGDMSVLTRAAAVLGQDVEALKPAEAAGLITVNAAGIDFRHPLARSAIYGDAAPGQRRAVHAALARSLPDADIDRRAWHLAMAAFGPDAIASSALEQAGLRARDRSAYDVASRAFERGARLAPDDTSKSRLLYAAADAASLGGLADRAISLLDEVAPIAATPDLVLQIEHLRGRIVARRGPIGQAQGILMAAAEQAASADPDLAVVMFAEAVHASFLAGDSAAMLLGAERAAAVMPRDASARTAFFGLIAQGTSQIFAGQAELGAEQLRHAVEILERSADLHADPRLLTWAAIASPWLRHTEVDQSLGDRALRAARRHAAVGFLPSVLNYVSTDFAGHGRWAEALAGFHEAIPLARETGQVVEVAFALGRLALLEARMGRADQSRKHAESTLSLSHELGLGLGEVWSITVLGELEFGRGNADAGLTRFEEVRTMLQLHAISDVDLSPAPELVDLYLRLGRAADAAAAAAEYSAAAIAKAQPWALARAARCRGLLAVGSDIVEEFETALALHRQTPDPFERARTMLAYGACLRRDQKRVQAREQLRAAIEIFDNLGADPWSDMARSELAATGETARRRDPASLNDLTPQELQIAFRVAEGRTNRETAAALFLSPKTIEYHLHSIYRKLAITSRRELMVAMARQRERSGGSHAPDGLAREPLGAAATAVPAVE